MKMESAAVAKGIRAASTNLVPRDGTKLRALFDFFMANKGIPVKRIYTQDDYNNTRYLRDTYGLDIRHLRRHTWVLAGEWFGRTYVDYIADQLAKSSRATLAQPPAKTFSQGVDKSAEP